MTSYSEVKVANNAKGSLAGGISANQGSLSLIGGEGAKFPTLNTGEYFYITVTSSALATNTEVMRVTARNADTLTITQPDGTARNSNNTFSAGDSVELRLTDNTLTDLFDLDVLLPDIPPDTDPSRERFSFYKPPVGHTLRRYLGPNGATLENVHSEFEKHRSFALKSDGTNTTYQPLNPSDISDDNNTNTGYLSIPVRAHPYIPHIRGNEMYKREFTDYSGTPFAGTWVEQTQSTNGNLYLMGEGHSIATQEGTLAYFDNVVDVDGYSTPSNSGYQFSAYGEHCIVYTTSNTVGSNIITFNDVRIHHVPITGNDYYPPDALPGPFGPTTIVYDWSGARFIGDYLFPPAVASGLVNIPPGTYITEATVTGSNSTNDYLVTATLNNNVVLPATYRMQLYKNRFNQLGKHYSASTKSTVYYKRDDLAPSPQTVNSDTNITNVNQDSYMPVSGNIGNVYVCTAGNPHSNGAASNSGRISSTQYYFQYDTNTTNGDFPTLANNEFGITVKPLSVNSVFTIKFFTGVYSDSGYAGFAFFCDYLDADPQPNSTRNFKNPNDNTTAKGVVLVGRHMHIDRYLQPEFNLNFTRMQPTSTGHQGFQYSFSTGQVTPGTWPNETTNTFKSPQTMTQSASNDYVTHNDGDNVNGADDNDYMGGIWHNSSHVFSGISSVQYFRPGVTDRVRFRVQFYREDNSGTAYFNYLNGHTACMVVEEQIHPYGSFGFDIPGGLDTTAHWNGNLVDA